MSEKTCFQYSAFPKNSFDSTAPNEDQKKLAKSKETRYIGRNMIHLPTRGPFNFRGSTYIFLQIGPASRNIGIGLASTFDSSTSVRGGEGGGGGIEEGRIRR